MNKKERHKGILSLCDDVGIDYSYLDISVVKHISDYIAVIYLGEIVEYASKKE